MPKRVTIILNPASGSARAQEQGQVLVQYLQQAGARLTLCETKAPGHGRHLAGTCCNDADVIISVGGDGTLNEIISGLADVGSRTPVALFPTGTANVVAKELGLPIATSELARIAVHGQVRELDLASAIDQAGTQRYFVMCAGVGLDAIAVGRVAATRQGKGISMLNYFIPAARAAWNYAFSSMRVMVDGREVDTESTFTIVANMQRYGGPFRFFGPISPDDGLLQVCCMHARSRLDLVRLAILSFLGRVPGARRVKHYSGLSVEIEAKERIPIQVDGEPAGELPIRLKLLPRAVRFCV